MGSSATKTVGEVLRYLDGLAPRATAEDWDNVGLLVGDPKQTVTGAVLSIDLTPEALEQATEKGYSLIINHHPCIFPKNRGLSKVTAGGLVYEAIRRGISVASYHTNFDQCSLEVVQAISKGLGITPKGRLFDQPHGTFPKAGGGVPGSQIEQLPSSHGLVSGQGYGFWGDFTSPRPFSDVAKDVKSLFNIHGFWITNPAPSQVTRVGFVAGKGASFVQAASAVQCDLMITGEAGYHTALSGLRSGVAVMELGHRESEKFFIETMKGWLSSLGIGFVEAITPTQKIWQEV